MNVRYTAHAQRRCRQRRITEGDIVRVVGNYLLSRPGDAGAIVYEGLGTDGRRVTVVLLPPGYTGPGCTVTVKTVWQTEGGGSA